MPVYRATVEGRDLPFLVDEQIEHIAFYKTVYFNAENLGYAAQKALDLVNLELEARAYVAADDPGAPRIFLESIERIEEEEVEPDTDFFWFFTEEDDFDDIELLSRNGKPGNGKPAGGKSDPLSSPQC